ncbi:MAG: hypothetical protein AAF432_04780 [Planctomycetota bacterium]
MRHSISRNGHAWIIALVAFATVAIGQQARAQDAYYVVEVGDLVDVAEVMRLRDAHSRHGVGWRDREWMYPYATLDGQGEIYLVGADAATNGGRGGLESFRVAMRVPVDTDVAGQVFIWRQDERSMGSAPFIVKSSDADVATQDAFLDIKAVHYERLLGRDTPGAAWFRFQAEQARSARGEVVEDTQPPAPRRWGAPTEMERTFALMSGGRALSENLQLDRLLPVATPDLKTVDVDSIDGITVREFDWTSLVNGLSPETDALAESIPADQHAVFFDSMEALIRVFDEAAANGAPVLQAIEPRAEDARSRQRYEEQLCLPLDALARQLGPRLVDAVAMTGSDPYLRTGTDVAVLFDAKNENALMSAIAASIEMNRARVDDAEFVAGDVLGVAYTGAKSPDRRICAYQARIGDAIVVTNSLTQLERLVRVHAGDDVALGSLDEYIYFRDRYPRGAENETALVIVSDATIRRWCGPRWRIGTSRRTRAVAVMSDVQAAFVDPIASGTVTAGPIHQERPLPDGESLSLTPSGVVSTTYGSMLFQTPIVEMDLDMVTKKEADLYVEWRDRYQRRWRNAFDPIAIRIDVREDALAMDMTVMPLIDGTSYREFREITGDAAIAPDAGDRHADSILHAAMALDRNSEMVRMYSGLAAGMAPQLKVEPLSWLGDSIAVYVDQDPIWDTIAKEDRPERFIEENLSSLPLVIHAEVDSGLKLAAFLAGVRAFIDQTAPQMTVWKNLTYNDVPYVRVAPSERAKADDDELENLAIYYSASGDALIVTTHEAALFRALDRQATRLNTVPSEGASTDVVAPWLGDSVALQVSEDIMPVLQALFDEEIRRSMEYAAWGNIAILNEWKRRYPDRDPVAVHEMLWQRRLICPAGGTYQWNDAWQTMESTVLGHPGQPREDVGLPNALRGIKALNAGITFEGDDGLRARAELLRASDR